MARIVSTDINPIVTAVFQTVKTDGSVINMEFKKDDTVSDLRYICDEEVAKVSGRISAINYDIRPTVRTYTELTKLRSNFASDVVMSTVDVDASEQYRADVVPVIAREVVENEGVTDVERMKYFLKFAAQFTISLTDGTVNTFTLTEGDDVKNLVYLGDGKELTIDGKLVAMKYNSQLYPTELVLISNGKIKIIEVLRVKSVGTVIAPVKDNASITDAIAASTDGIVGVAAGEFTAPVSFEKDMVLSGAKAGIPGTLKSARKSGESVLTGAITVKNGANVTIDGFTLTGDALMNIAGAGDVTLKNCVITNITPSAAKSFFILGGTADTAKVSVTGCYFGENKVVDNKKIYNLFEINTILKDGSTFENNYFAKGCSNHNDINIYQVEENATITIKNNYWEFSANAVRIGIKGQPKCNVILENNTYKETDANPDWAGLLLIQPYGTATTSFENLTVVLNNTVYEEAVPGVETQIFYTYAGGSDTPLTPYNVPTVIVDGETVLAPIPANASAGN